MNDIIHLKTTEQKCCDANLDPYETCGNETTANIREKFCSGCKALHNFNSCPYSCDDCDGKKAEQEKKYFQAEKQCCQNKTEDCPNSNKNNPYCSKCETWYDFYMCPHTCDDCDGKKLKQERKYHQAEEKCCADKT